MEQKRLITVWVVGHGTNRARVSLVDWDAQGGLDPRPRPTMMGASGVSLST
jgi:hypothetical protein